MKIEFTLVTVKSTMFTYNVILILVLSYKQRGGTTMKLAISGKGGVGKTTFSSLLVRVLSNKGEKILAIDADPDANFASALGITGSSKIPPIADMKNLIFERTGAKPGSSGGFFKINPKVDDIPDRLSLKKDNIKLIRLGSVKQGGSGCLCPESTLLKALVGHIVVRRGEWVVMDMEAGIEHLGRATAQFVDKLIIVVEPGQRSIETAKHICKLATEIKINEISIVGNKIRNREDKKFLQSSLLGFDFLGFIKYDETIVDADMRGVSPYDVNSEVKDLVSDMIDKL